jgi:hypothetical protein
MEEIKDARNHRICVASIERHSMDVQQWHHTLIGTMHAGIAELHSGELPIVSIYFSPASWCVLTSRRVLGVYYGRKVELDVSEVSETNFGNFKGLGCKTIEVMTIRTPMKSEFRLEYETGKASMAPIYYFSFWQKKYPIIDKLAP